MERKCATMAPRTIGRHNAFPLSMQAQEASAVSGIKKPSGLRLHRLHKESGKEALPNLSDGELNSRRTVVARVAIGSEQRDADLSNRGDCCSADEGMSERTRRLRTPPLPPNPPHLPSTPKEIETRRKSRTSPPKKKPSTHACSGELAMGELRHRERISTTSTLCSTT